MARVSIRKFFKISVSFLSHPNPAPALIQPSRASHVSSLSHFRYSPKAHSLYKKNLDYLDSCQSLTHLFQIQANLITSGLLQHPSFSGRFMKICSHFSVLDYVVLVFRCIVFPSTFVVNTVIKAYACSSVPQKAVIFYFEMLEYGFFPSSFSFPPLFSGCAKLKCLNLGEKCHGQVVKNGVDGVLPVQNSLIHFYACCGLMESVLKIVVNMSVRDVVSWNTIIDSFAKLGELDLAHKLFDTMPQRNVVSWNIMMTGYLDLGNPGNGLKLFREMVKLGFKGNETTMVNVLTACGRSARLKEGKSVHGTLVRESGNLSLIVNTSLIDMYCRCGRVDNARSVFDRMPMKSLVSWNAMILGHCIHGNPKDGLNLYDQMTSKSSRLEDGKTHMTNKWSLGNCDGIIPDEVTFIGLLLACAREERLTEGRNYFGQMIDVYGVKPNFVHYWCMASILDKVGQRKEAIELLQDMPVVKDASPESSLWADLFSSCRFQGDTILGEQLAKRLIEQDPQNFSYHVLLVNVYAVAGKWEDVARIKAVMKENGIKRIPGCSLEDLTGIVQKMKLGAKWQEFTDSCQLRSSEVND
ncbi:pentatricopeptide repeat-containing protein At3g51320 [Coffea eugenioides]|uniref:pentatricopeptide repeat-containing protein At3g51320 n=1 Tax=Coffea eugenioides TaxID=49369 RepID=UPI000F609D51|nr:pentatricopeptide repeat-containing protein At3g51320 [Coffea eugenioides]